MESHAKALGEKRYVRGKRKQARQAVMRRKFSHSNRHRTMRSHAQVCTARHVRSGRHACIAGRLACAGRHNQGGVHAKLIENRVEGMYIQTGMNIDLALAGNN